MAPVTPARLIPPAARRLAIGAVLVAAVALAACGDRAATDEQQVRETLTEFNRAAAEHDYARICDELLAPELLDGLRRVELPCETAWRQGLRGVRNSSLSIRDVQVDGDRATARVRTSASGQEPAEVTMELVRTGDGWRIAALGG